MTTLSSTTSRRPQEESEAGLWNLLVQQDDNTLYNHKQKTPRRVRSWIVEPSSPTRWQHSTTTSRRPQEESEAGLWNLLVQQDDNTLYNHKQKTPRRVRSWIVESCSPTGWQHSTTTSRRPQEEPEAGLWNLLVQQDDNTFYNHKQKTPRRVRSWIVEPFSPTGWQHFLQTQAEDPKKRQKLDCETL